MRTTLLATSILAMLTLHGCGSDGEKAEDPTVGASDGDTTTTSESADSRSTQSCQVLEPTIPGYTPGVGQVPRILLGIDLWAPWASVDPADGGNLVGMLPEFVEIMKDVCTDVDVEWIHTAWGDCFAEPEGASWVGGDIKFGAIHGCAGYTHTFGTRNRLFEFSDAVTTSAARTGGIITRLEGGVPVVSSTSDLSGVKVVDVAGWAPTQDNLQQAVNDCTGSKFDYANIDFVAAPTEGNAAPMAMLKNGEVDAIWVYSDQGNTCSDALDTPDCAGWEGFGTEYAYIHQGQAFAANGTTISMSKRGSGVAKLLNACIEKALATEAYEKLCKRIEVYESCIPNSFFTNVKPVQYYNVPHSKQTADQVKTCADGFCPCPAS